MDLTCLNCGGSFEVDDGRVDAAGGVFQCPICGRSQPLARRPATQPDPRGRKPEPIVPRDTGASAFRKPMQAFTGLKPKAAATTTGQIPVPRDPGGDSQVVPLPPPLETPPVPEARMNAAIAAAAAAVTEGAGTWQVKSPTGLVFEFPSSTLLVNWSSVVENPAPYMVSRGGDDWTSLEGFLREVRTGSRATQAFRRVTNTTLTPAPFPAGKATPPEAPAPALAPPPGDAGALRADPAAAGAPTPTPAVPADRRVSTTAQFQFKLANPPKSSVGRTVIIVALSLVAVGAAIAAVFLLGR